MSRRPPALANPFLSKSDDVYKIDDHTLTLTPDDFLMVSNEKALSDDAAALLQQEIAASIVAAAPAAHGTAKTASGRDGTGRADRRGGKATTRANEYLQYDSQSTVEQEEELKAWIAEMRRTVEMHTQRVDGNQDAPSIMQTLADELKANAERNELQHKFEQNMKDIETNLECLQQDFECFRKEAVSKNEQIQKMAYENAQKLKNNANVTKVLEEREIAHKNEMIKKDAEISRLMRLLDTASKEKVAKLEERHREEIAQKDAQLSKMKKRCEEKEIENKKESKTIGRMLGVDTMLAVVIIAIAACTNNIAIVTICLVMLCIKGCIWMKWHSGGEAGQEHQTQMQEFPGTNKYPSVETKRSK